MTLGIDIVIPTMWRPSGVLDSLIAYSESPHIQSIIVIDNDFSRRPDIPAEVLTRLKIIDHGHNIYVNQAWNEGVALCESDLICIANDDIKIDPLLFGALRELNFEEKRIDLVGVDLNAQTSDTYFRKLDLDRTRPLGTQYPTFGAFMVMPRLSYKPIPPDLKVWYGDDYLAYNSSNVYLLSSPLVVGGMSTTIKNLAETTPINQLIQKDIEWAKANLLEVKVSNNSPAPLTVTVVKIDQHQKTAVDLGCGMRPQNPFAAERVIGIDSQCNSEGVISCWVGFEPLPLADSSVDFVTAFDFIEHLPRFALRDKPFNPFIDAMSEIWRVLKPNGIFFARTPAYPSAAAFQDPTHVNIITDQTVSYFAKRPCVDGTFIDPWGPPLGKLYGFKGEFQLIKQWWETTHLCWQMSAVK